MIETRTLVPGITLHCCRDSRFKQGCLSIQLLRPMHPGESAKNALLPSVLLRGTRLHRDLRAITDHLDSLYGAAVSPLVRRVGDCQTMGLYAAFLEERFALEGDRIFAPMVDFLNELLLDPLTEKGCFLPEIVESEKKNLISTIASELNDKRTYSLTTLLKNMCAGDSFALPRLGTPEAVAAITPEELYAHYRAILKTSPIHLFCVTDGNVDAVAEALMPLARHLGQRQAPPIPQTPLRDTPRSHTAEEMDVTQGKLCLGFTTPITNRSADFVPMQLLNTVLGAGMTSKLFMNVREKLSLCYSIGSSYYSTKGILTVAAGIDFDQEPLTRQEILNQLEACRRGDITSRELDAARAAMVSSLRSTQDSPGAMESYYATAAISGLNMTPEEYMEAISAVTIPQITAAANTLTLHSSFFLKGVSQ